MGNGAAGGAVRKGVTNEVTTMKLEFQKPGMQGKEKNKRTERAGARQNLRNRSRASSQKDGSANAWIMGDAAGLKPFIRCRKKRNRGKIFRIQWDILQN